ncbi:hypothetical protein SAMN06265339_1057 [Desulfurobacterium pacificum]|uniref:Uncharacterized protein n=1 Tax=Desulfurobacterium pacificum TaxID=240166 RepID=A0ABY1NL49_9BACT|nr:hypothetical protein [Desulfurobacterium pacificum]SMP12559.1 hypothetical protein SAMN06265339_1057 [Desulfurobacterium pacificum]
MKVLQKETSIKELLKSERLSFQNLKELEEWLKNNVVVKGKREIVKNPSKAFKENVVVVTDRKEPTGVYISLKAANKLPPELQAFLFMTLNVIGCKYLLRG